MTANRSTRLRCLVYALVLALLPAGALLAAPAENAASEMTMETPIDLSLKDAGLDDLLRSMARVLGADLGLDPALEGEVTVELDNVQLGEALSEVCRINDCHWRYLPGDPAVLRVLSKEGKMAELLSLSLREADLEEIFQSFAGILGLEPALDPAVAGTLDIELTAVPLADALDGVCAKAGCRWWPEGGKLRVAPSLNQGVKPAASSHTAAGGVRLAGPQPEPDRVEMMEEAVPVEARLRGPGASAQAAAPLTWRRPTLSVSASGSTGAGDARRWGATISRVALAEKDSVLVPVLHRCSAAGAGLESHAFEPLAAELKSPWRGEWEGAVLELRSGAAAAGLEGQGAEGLPCRAPRFLRVRLLRGDAASVDAQVTRPGEVLVLAREGGAPPEMAVMLLGWSTGRPVAGLLSGGGKAGALPRLRQRALGGSDTWTESWDGASGTATLTIEVGAF